MKCWGSLGLAFMMAACSTTNPPSITARNGKYYAVATEQANFYRYGPQQGTGPDQKLPRDTLLRLLQEPSFGYVRVQLVNGDQGFVAREDIREASPKLLASITSPPSTQRTQRFRPNSNDPRLIAPPEPLPEPTPLPGTEDSPDH